ncbi:MAG: ATP-binding protein [Kouleothrix sp.]|nr:ATP-binding protein [Kouleothrix sp.]
MSGAPGSGKSTLARAIAPQLKAVIIDHDITKSALLEASIPVALAGSASYTILHALARDLLTQRWSVIFDSPCFYPELLDRGQALAHAAGVPYRYIECRLDDLPTLDQRLRTRARLPSQLAGITTPPTAGSGKAVMNETIFRDWIAHMKRPPTNYLIVDTAQPLPVCVAQALAYVRAIEP